MEPSYLYRATITRVIDGDTYDVDVDAGFHIVVRMPLRLAHIDTPEKYTDAGKIAKAKAEQLVGDLPREVLVRTFKVSDKYGRYLADIFIDGVSLADTLIAGGYGLPYEGGTKTPVAAQRPARASRRARLRSSFSRTLR